MIIIHSLLKQQQGLNQMKSFTYTAYNVSSSISDGYAIVEDSSDNAVIPISYIDDNGVTQYDQFEGPAYEIATWVDSLPSTVTLTREEGSHKFK